MKRLLMLVLTLIALKSEAQVVEMGLRDNQFARIGYVTNKGFYLSIEQSMLNVKLKVQSGRLYAGCRLNRPFWNADASIYGGTEYSGHWQTWGGFFRGGYIYRWLNVTGTINPNYDSGLDFQLNYDFAIGLKVWENKDYTNQYVAFKTSYGNVPEFRDNVKNLRVGLKFNNGSLWVLPEVVVPRIGEDNIYIRVLCNFGWSLTL